MKYFLFTDSHYGIREESCKIRRPNKSLEKLRSLEHIIKSCDGIICLGDITDDGDRMICRRCLEEVSDYLHSLSDNVYSLMGNHDCINFSPSQFTAFSGFKQPPFFVDSDACRMILLDANYLASGSHYLYSNVDWKNTVLPGDQLSFLEKALSTIEDRYPVILLHQCVDPMSEPRHRVGNYGRFTAIVEAFGKECTVIQGHYHHGARRTFGKTHYLTLPALCELERTPYAILDTKNAALTLGGCEFLPEFERF